MLFISPVSEMWVLDGFLDGPKNLGLVLYTFHPVYRFIHEIDIFDLPTPPGIGVLKTPPRIGLCKNCAIEH